MTAVPWPEALDRFGERLDAALVAWEDGHPDSVPPFEPPDGLGPLPPSLRRRAEELLADAARLEGRMEERIAATRSPNRTIGEVAPGFDAHG